VIGFDLAGDEGTYPLNIHRDAFLYAKENNIPTTCHVGEFPER
jgi:adenosine deaminase